MKPLARWTIGNVSDIGFEILSYSVKYFRKLYPEFDCIICYNEITEEKISILVDKFLQTHDCCKIPIKPYSNAWKLFPPRLRINSHELFIDNDLIIHKKIPQIDEFISGNRHLCYGCHDLTRAFPYGRFSNFFSKNKKNFILNSGLFGLPPKYDFESEIIKNLNEIKISNWENFDEQGLVAKCLLDKNPIIILDSQISNCWLDYKFGECGCHFCGHNHKNLSSWSKYKRQKILI